MIIMRGDYVPKEESRVEEICKININDMHNRKVSISICCTEVSQEWSYSDGLEEVAAAWLLYSVAQTGKNTYVNGIHCSSDSPLGGYWLERGAVKVLEKQIIENFKCDMSHIFFDRKDPYKAVNFYDHLLGHRSKPEKVVGKYSLVKFGRIHSIYQGDRPLVSISDLAEGIFLNKWNLVHVPHGFPHEDSDFVKRDFFDSWEYILQGYH